MIERQTKEKIEEYLSRAGAVLLIGLPRIGRTSLARTILNESGGGPLFDPSHIKMLDPQTFCEEHAGSLVVMDGIGEESVPVVSAIVRASSDIPSSPPRLLLLPCDGATAYRLQCKLVGLLKAVELIAIQPDEIAGDALAITEAAGPLTIVGQTVTISNRRVWNQEEHWLRGGLPQSLFADDDRDSFNWRVSYLEALRRCDLRPWGIDAGDRPFEILQWLANGHGQRFDVTKCASILSVPKPRIRLVVSAFEELGLIRQLPNWPAGTNRSMGDLPVVYLRDSGLLHSLVGIRARPELERHELFGHSWEGFAIEALLNTLGGAAWTAYYRDAEECEIDLVVNFLDNAVWAMEFKTNPDKKAESGFWRACDQIDASNRMIVHAGSAIVTHTNGLQGVPLLTAISRIRAMATRSRS